MAFLGLECATIPADHVKDPEKTIPRATLYGTVIAAVFYILCTTAVMGIIPAGSLMHSNAPFADAAKLLWGGWAGNLIAAAAVISCFGALNGWILMSGQCWLLWLSHSRYGPARAPAPTRCTGALC